MTLVLVIRNFCVLTILTFPIVSLSHLRIMDMGGMVPDSFKNILNEFVVLNIIKKGYFNFGQYFVIRTSDDDSRRPISSKCRFRVSIITSLGSDPLFCILTLYLETR